MMYEVECNECDETFESDDEEEAVGWMFGHSMASGHEDLDKNEV